MKKNTFKVTNEMIDRLPDMQRSFAKYLVFKGEIVIVKDKGSRPSTPTKVEMDRRTTNTRTTHTRSVYG